jgi:superfamily II DNA/RNA helicase
LSAEFYLNEIRTILEKIPMVSHVKKRPASTAAAASSSARRRGGDGGGDDYGDEDGGEDSDEGGNLDYDLDDMGDVDDVYAGPDDDELEEEDDEEDDEMMRRGQKDSEQLQKDMKENSSLFCFASATASNPDVQRFCQEYAPASEWQFLSTSGGSLEAGDGPDMGKAGTGSECPASLTHALMITHQNRAFTALQKFLTSEPKINSALIFVNNPYKVEILCENLLAEGIIAAPLHGKSSKDDRKEIVSRISDGRLQYVVTTEMSARGLDIPLLSHVINFELPPDTQHYVHRSGRCGRLGRPGFVMNFVNPENKFVMRRFGKKLRLRLYDAEIRKNELWMKENNAVR